MLEFQSLSGLTDPDRRRILHIRGICPAHHHSARQTRHPISLSDTCSREVPQHRQDKVPNLFGRGQKGDAMYAVIRTGGKQYRVAPGTILEVEKLEAAVGDTIQMDDVLLLADGKTVHIGQPVISGAAVTAKVTGQHRAKKIQVFRYRPKKRIRVRRGHRQYLTRLEIQGMSLNGAELYTPAPAVVEPAQEEDVVEEAAMEEAAMEAAPEVADVEVADVEEVAAEEATEAVAQAEDTDAADDESADEERTN
jgi:large subunit ribosomal protein L21